MPARRSRQLPELDLLQMFDAAPRGDLTLYMSSGQIRYRFLELIPAALQNTPRPVQVCS